jgi:uncharacterized membrane protein YtjA (UPF0391 family)
MMLKWALIFFVISLIAGGLGLSRQSTAHASLARMLFFIAIVICVIFVMLAIMAGEMPM